MKKTLNEDLGYHDLKNMVVPRVSVDEYAAKMGRNSDIVTLSFIVKSEAAGKDLADWIEKGYDFVLDAKLSEGELKPNVYLVFVELERRRAVVKQIIEIIDDLKTVTSYGIDDWDVVIDSKEYHASHDDLDSVIITSPHEYRVEKEDQTELNEMRDLAGIPVVISETREYNDQSDIDLKNFKSLAGL